ncbi:MAG: hypothetical protein EAZ95_09430 [Bacteroidetes bacterium]|nr:MAG: hypothetical protein EAZ95_09430 [Bacteroidota bacterium]
MKSTLLSFLLSLACLQASAQDSLLTVLARQNVTTFEWKDNAFQGVAWERLTNEMKKTNNVLIGEDHFFQEIPLFTSEVVKIVKFDNFICEIDTYTAKILEARLTKPAQNEAFFKQYKSAFSFYALAPEFKLLEQLAKDKVKFWGTDQITAMSDGLICAEWAGKTKNKQARAIYEKIQAQSKDCMAKFLQNPQEPFYMFKPDFSKDLEALLALPVSSEEKEQIEALKLSVRIYTEQNHALRIQLMKNQFFKNLPALQNKRNLYKYGAVHTPKGESSRKSIRKMSSPHDCRQKWHTGISFRGYASTYLEPRKWRFSFPETLFQGNRRQGMALL